MTSSSTGTSTSTSTATDQDGHDVRPLTAAGTARRVRIPSDVSLGLLLLRLVLAVVFVAHGAQKLWINGIPATQQGFSGMGVPFPEITAIAVAVLEVAGGLLLALGLGTRIVAAILAVDMIVAMVLVHLAAGFFAAEGGYEFVLTLAVASSALVFTGPGRFAVDALIRRGR